MDHSPSPLPVKKEPSELDSLKRKSRSESNDENKKKKPAPNLDDIKPQKMNTGESSRSLCGICFNSKSDPDMFKINTCNHSFCVDCISKYMDSQITNKVVKVTCPNPNCYTKLKPEHLKTYCPFEDCSIWLVNEDSGGEVVVTSCECPYCHRLFCAQCRVPWHEELRRVSKFESS
ncbi:uncharacterized protein LOC131658650 [Vicia villosa]|uniref:uncharacterized protein LOC131658650 n=1 Tax=Vicia villosa TaxID=3911 RepID=UPI00273B57E7|nr:uncharacterized protein LOC131658650 [Vicia villosa]